MLQQCTRTEVTCILTHQLLEVRDRADHSAPPSLGLGACQPCCLLVAGRRRTGRLELDGQAVLAKHTALQYEDIRHASLAALVLQPFPSPGSTHVLGNGRANDEQVTRPGPLNARLLHRGLGLLVRAAEVRAYL